MVNKIFFLQYVYVSASINTAVDFHHESTFQLKNIFKW